MSVEQAGLAAERLLGDQGGDGVAVRGGIVQDHQAVLRAQQAEEGVGWQFADFGGQGFLGGIGQREDGDQVPKLGRSGEAGWMKWQLGNRQRSNEPSMPKRRSKITGLLRTCPAPPAPQPSSRRRF